LADAPSGEKTGKKSNLLPPRMHGDGTAWRRRPRDAAAPTTHIYTPCTPQPSLVRYPRDHRARSAPNASQVVRISKEGTTEAYQNMMPLPRLPGCTKCRSDSDASLSRRTTGVARTASAKMVSRRPYKRQLARRSQACRKSGISRGSG